MEVSLSGRCQTSKVGVHSIRDVREVGEIREAAVNSVGGQAQRKVRFTQEFGVHSVESRGSVHSTQWEMSEYGVDSVTHVGEVHAHSDDLRLRTSLLMGTRKVIS